MDGRDHVRRAIRHYLEKDDDLAESSQDAARLNRSIQAAFVLARAAVSAARDVRDMVLRLPSFEPGRPSILHRHYEATWSFLGSLWELIDFCELEQEVASADVEDPVWFFGRALDQHLGGNPFEALSLLDEAGLSREAADPWVQLLRAEALAATGEQVEAIAAWDAAAALDPLLTQAHVSVAGELEALGRDEEAMAHWSAVLDTSPRDDPVAAEAKRHLTRLAQRREKKATSPSGARFARLPRWGPSWVPAWPGRGRPAAAPDHAVEAELVAEGVTEPSDGNGGGPARVGRLEALLGFSGSRDRDLTVAVVGGDPVSEGAVGSRSAAYLGGGRLVGGVAPALGDLEREEPDVIVLASGIGVEQCADLAEVARALTLHSRTGPVVFLFNGPLELHRDLGVVFADLSLETIPDILAPDQTAGGAVATGSTVTGPAATVAAIERKAKECGGARPALRASLARGALGLAPALEWLDSAGRWPAGRHPPFDLVLVSAEAEAVEALAVKGDQVAGSTFGPGGEERGELLEDLFSGMPRVLPPGDMALLMGRLLGGAQTAQVGDGAEALVAGCLTAGVLAHAMVGLREALAAQTSYGARSSHLLVGGSLLSRLPDPEHALLAAVDGCQPTGVTRVLLDPYGVVAALGQGLADGRLTAEDASVADGTASLLAGSCLCVAPLVQAVKWDKPGHRLVLQASVKGAWRDGERTWQLSRGELIWVPLPAGRRIELVVRPEPPYNVGRGRGVEWRGDFVAGGLGLLLDGRGRPLRLPADEIGRTTLQAAWMAEIAGKAGGR